MTELNVHSAGCYRA